MPKVKRGATAPFGSEPETVKVITATLYETAIDFPAGGMPFKKLDDVLAVKPAVFRTMAFPRIIAGVGQNTLQSLGVFQGQSGSPATETDPYQRNFWAIKVDHCGFNACNVDRFPDGCNDFGLVKTSSNVVEITLPQPPMSKAMAPTVIRPTNMSMAQMTGYQTRMFGGGVSMANVAFDETHASGAWEYMIIPAQLGGSVKLSIMGTLTGWQRLLDMGFRPKKCTRSKYRISVVPKGQDGVEIRTVYRKLADMTSTGIIPSSNAWADAQQFQGSEQRQHHAQDTDWCCQYSTLYPTDTFAGSQQIIRDIQAQGFDVMAYGSAIVFQFIQYAPPTSDTPAIDTSVCQIIPATLTVHNKTTFSKRRTVGFDLCQVMSLPVILNNS